jgi:hypothetical protein
MAKEKSWFKKASSLRLHKVLCLGYRHADTIFPALPPSPNLRTPLSIMAYPSLCLFEGTTWSVGRGTSTPFECYGYPDSLAGSYRFVPEKNQIHGGKVCFGKRVLKEDLNSCFSLKFLLDAKNKRPNDTQFLNSFFIRLSGGKELISCIRSGREFQGRLSAWLKLRSRFLLYP